ncbi:TAXI family TRAP transporter solute-binding subunit [Kitasatospora sp. NPDC051914]|uniref:TAXI family TRAP transporter solute-binding subunit n=1 Tax=Kitasatospora sp. NPDC051914 TaxID=3154945 RepID=UPI00342831B6
MVGPVIPSSPVTPPRPGPGRRTVVGALLGWGAAGCGAAREPVGRLRLATGPEGGPYNAFGRALAAATVGQRPAVVPRATAASVDNLRRLDDGSVELALAMADTAEDAVRGRNSFTRPLPVSALARVYVNYTHLLTPADGPVHTLADLAGRRVAVGADGSGVQVVARRLLETAALTGGAGRVTEVPLALGESVAALRAGRVDALFWSGGVPTPAVAELARELPLRVLALDGPAEVLRARHGPVYTAAAFPAGVYGLRAPVGTVGVGNYLLARTDVSADAVRAVLRTVFDSWRDLLREVTAGARLEPRFAVSTGAVPLHPGASAYYRSVYG